MYSKRSSLSSPSRVLSNNFLEFWYNSDSVPPPLPMTAPPPTAAVPNAITNYADVRTVTRAV